jgi:protein-S-isoprenylcysteine O-methyltransferase Ste14
MVGSSALYLGSLMAAIFPPLFVLFINRWQIQREELALEEVFGEKYQDYRQKVRR